MDRRLPRYGPSPPPRNPIVRRSCTGCNADFVRLEYMAESMALVQPQGLVHNRHHHLTQLCRDLTDPLRKPLTGDSGARLLATPAPVTGPPATGNSTPPDRVCLLDRPAGNRPRRLVARRVRCLRPATEAIKSSLRQFPRRSQAVLAYPTPASPPAPAQLPSPIRPRQSSSRPSAARAAPVTLRR